MNMQKDLKEKYQFFKTLTEINTMVVTIVNDETVPINYQLKNKDRVRIITDNLSFGPRENWIDIVQTIHAKKKIKEFN